MSENENFRLQLRVRFEARVIDVGQLPLGDLISKLLVFLAVPEPPDSAIIPDVDNDDQSEMDSSTEERLYPRNRFVEDAAE